MTKARLGARVLKGLEEARDHASGMTVARLVEHLPTEIDVGAIRRRTRLSQAAFAEMIAVKLPTLRNWEQGRRKPEGPARVLLTMVNEKPDIVIATLAPRLAKPSVVKKGSGKKRSSKGVASTRAAA